MEKQNYKKVQITLTKVDVNWTCCLPSVSSAQLPIGVDPPAHHPTADK
jgi:hypothetical protein